ncbi:MAG: pyridoxamine 5'-phosphate oxidase [Candidatus Protochlamydia sp.]|nr:pyridoxamine 5'-phosphate oxidase [Candidatus Protochlamydia sp.]
MLPFQILRKEYKLKRLERSSLDSDPFTQFKSWFEEACKAQVVEPNAMSLATASLEGRPSCRIVLLKGIDQKGLLFFTNYESRKGKELNQNPYATLCFFWKELERQVIIEGPVEKISTQESELYFNSRPRGSKITAWLSRQSQFISNREDLEEEYQLLMEEYEEKNIPMPSYWGGYRLIPERFEFWQGRENRLHDRFQYLVRNNNWTISQLYP